jgi:hypothetical protein
MKNSTISQMMNRMKIDATVTNTEADADLRARTEDKATARAFRRMGAEVVAERSWQGSVRGWHCEWVIYCPGYDKSKMDQRA